MSFRTCLRNLDCLLMTDRTFLLFLLPAPPWISSYNMDVEFCPCWEQPCPGAWDRWVSLHGNEELQSIFFPAWLSCTYPPVPVLQCLLVINHCSSFTWQSKDDYGEEFELVKHLESKEMLSRCKIILFFKSSFCLNMPHLRGSLECIIVHRTVVQIWCIMIFLCGVWKITKGRVYLL